MKPAQRINAAGKPLSTVVWRPLPDAAIRARRYGAGEGVYVDPAEAVAAQATAELLHQVREAAGASVVRIAAAAFEASAWGQAGAAIRQAQGARHGS
jgi:hypothetical protein